MGGGQSKLLATLEGFNYLETFEVSKSSTENKKGFTLAEVLITLGIIGVVAAITMSMLITNINERANSERQANIAHKITQAMEQMRAHGELDGSYKSTDEFVDVLQKYLKIAKRCDANNIASCWPTTKVTTADGNEYEVKNAKTRHDLIIGVNGSNTNNVGLVLSDGASLILTYNTASNAIDIGDRVTASKKDLPVGMGKFKEFAYTTSVTSSIDFITDVNGKKGPNSETINNKYNDIRAFKGASFSKGCGSGIKVLGYCLLNLGTSYDCIDTCSDTTWDNQGGTSCSNNCWAGAQKACDDLGMYIPSHRQHASFFNSKGLEGIPTDREYFSSEPSTSTGENFVVHYMNFSWSRYSSKSEKSSLFCIGK